MENSIFVSVTVPVYNTSKYLRRCLDSLTSQSIKQIEFIIVDDGSTDDSGIICDEYAAYDSRFKVIHQENGGLSVARQTGLENAKGEYIIVCDSDDWVETNMYEKLYDVAKNTNADIVICGYIAEYNDGHSVLHPSSYKEIDGFVDNYDLLSRGANTSWVKLIRRSLFEKTNSCYDAGVNLSEDSLIIYKLLKGNPKIVQISDPLYHYRRLRGKNTYTNSVRMENIFQLEYTYFWLKNNYTGKKYRPIITQRAIDIAFTCLRVSDLQNDYLKRFICKELKWRTLLFTKVSLKTIMVCVEKVLPVRFSKNIFKYFYPFFYK